MPGSPFTEFPKFRKLRRVEYCFYRPGVHSSSSLTIKSMKSTIALSALVTILAAIPGFLGRMLSSKTDQRFLATLMLHLGSRGPGKSDSEYSNFQKLQNDARIRDCSGNIRSKALVVFYNPFKREPIGVRQRRISGVAMNFTGKTCMGRGTIHAGQHREPVCRVRTQLRTGTESLFDKLARVRLEIAPIKHKMPQDS